MRHIFYRSKILLLIFSMVAMLFALGGMAYLKNTQIYRPFPQISGEGIIGNITSPDGVGGQAAFIEFSEMLEDEDAPFLFAAYFLSIKSAAVYYSGAEIFPVKLSEGRVLNQQDFESHANVVMVNSAYKTSCSEQGGRLWWSHEGDEYEVIGLYESSEDNAQRAFFNITADNLSSDLFGYFVFDAGEDSAALLNRVSASYHEKYPDTFIGFVSLAEAKGSEYIHEGATGFGAMELMLIATAVLVLINALSVGMGWLSWFGKEFSVRMLCGATRQKVRIWIAGKWLSFLVVSELLGLLGAAAFLVITRYLPVSESVRLMFGGTLEIKGVAVGLLVLLLLGGMVTAIIMLLASRDPRWRRIR